VASLNGGTASREALNEFCLRYRPVILEFVQFSVSDHTQDDPEDVTQEFFLRLLESRAWKRADRARGRFRSFLLGALKHHLADRYRRRQAGKRGAAVTHLPFNEFEEAVSGEEPLSVSVADAVFDRSWALTMVENALESVAGALDAAGQGDRFKRLAVFLQAGSDNPPYDQLAPVLGLTVAGVKTEVHRLRKRFRQALRTEVARTVSAPHEIDTELAYLHSVLATTDRPGAGEEPRGARTHPDSRTDARRAGASAVGLPHK
jgi:RNA polymerase sigma factor (sigma-70 family)